MENDEQAILHNIRPHIVSALVAKNFLLLDIEICPTFDMSNDRVAASETANYI